jgi:hypothetical protein
MNESERDPRLDAAWRAASCEEPPPALDAAIRAAARRAVDAPTAGGRGKHWWYPLAAAATVALLAVGIAQLTPPERVAPATVADSPAVPAETGNGNAPGTAAPDARREAPAAAPPPPVPTPQAYALAKPAARSVGSAQAVERARDSAGKLVPEPAASAKAEFSRQDQLAAAAPQMAPANIAPPASASVNAPPVTAHSEPFPAAPPTQRTGDAYLEPRSPTVDATAQAVPEPPPVQARAAARKVAPAEEAKITDASAPNVDEWIKRIRVLKDAGRLDDVAKELARFRAAYGERADALLPEDLRQTKR